MGSLKTSPKIPTQSIKKEESEKETMKDSGFQKDETEDQAKLYDELKDDSVSSEVRDQEAKYKKEIKSVETSKELDVQSIFKIISKSNFRGQKKELKEKLVKDLNSIIQRESVNGFEMFSFEIIKTLILQVESQAPELKEVSRKIIKMLEEAF